MMEGECSSSCVLACCSLGRSIWETELLRMVNPTFITGPWEELDKDEGCLKSSGTILLDTTAIGSLILRAIIINLTKIHIFAK